MTRQVNRHSRHAQPFGVGLRGRNAESLVGALGGDADRAADGRQGAAVGHQRRRLGLVLGPGAHPVKRGDRREHVVEPQAL